MERMRLPLNDDMTEQVRTMRITLRGEVGAIVCASFGDSGAAGDTPSQAAGSLLMERLNEMGGNEARRAPARVVELLFATFDEVPQCPVHRDYEYYVIRPVEYHELQQYCRAPASKSRRLAATEIAEIENLCTNSGIPSNIQGYEYIIEAIRLAVEDAAMIRQITKKLYPDIARSCNTTSSKVERSIRHAISVLWSRGRIEVINEVFGYPVCKQEKKMTNGQFISLMANHFRK